MFASNIYMFLLNILSWIPMFHHENFKPFVGERNGMTRDEERLELGRASGRYWPLLSARRRGKSSTRASHSAFPAKQ
jgi:hypothetical protein